jgi:type VI secretion system secreted protein Hcp
VAVDYFLDLSSGGVTGESTDQDFPNTIELESWNWGAVNPPDLTSAKSGAGTGRVSVEHIHCSSKMSKASPRLFKFCANGEHFPTAKIVCRKAGGGQQPFLQIDLEEAYIAHYHTGGNAGEKDPFDNFALAYGKIKVDYKEQAKDGTTSSTGPVTLDIRTNQLS